MGLPPSRLSLDLRRDDQVRDRPEIGNGGGTGAFSSAALIMRPDRVHDHDGGNVGAARDLAEQLGGRPAAGFAALASIRRKIRRGR